ncbi:MAG: sulfurtransferase TusA family protein [Pseudomonadota bacterium]|nr:sulfurtransferase TusA family protein [Pseudomonadota bacterium]
MSSQNGNRVYDASGLLCPMPIIHLQQQLAALAKDEILQILCTDRGTLQDIPAWCDVNGHTLIHQSQDSNDRGVTTYCFWIQK